MHAFIHFQNILSVFEVRNRDQEAKTGFIRLSDFRESTECKRFVLVSTIVNVLVRQNSLTWDLVPSFNHTPPTSHSEKDWKQFKPRVNINQMLVIFVFSSSIIR